LSDLKKFSVVMVSRGRPEGLSCALESLYLTAADKDNLELIVGIDDDDHQTLEHIAKHPVPAARFVVGPRDVTFHQTLNRLADQARGDYLVGFGDDYEAVTFGWDQIASAQANHFALGEVLMAWRDPGQPGFPTLYMVPRAWLAFKPFANGLFPYWWSDTEWDEIARYAGLYVQPDIHVTQPGGRGRTYGLRDLNFWRDLFQRLRPEREAIADRIIARCLPDWAHAAALQAREDRRLLHIIKLMQFDYPEITAEFEAHQSGAGHKRYSEARALAEQVLQNLLAQEGSA
jgi:hypothetical protein